MPLVEASSPPFRQAVWRGLAATSSHSGCLLAQLALLMHIARNPDGPEVLAPANWV
jgi:hypothetical protein